MLIVIDTTETFQHPMLTSPDWTYLQSFLQREIATLIVPEIVVSETINHFKLKLTTALAESHRSVGKLRKLMPDVEAVLPELDVAAATAEYENSLQVRLKELGAQIPEFSGIELQTIVRRALERRKPFDPKGQCGMRDAILWETVLKLAREEDEPLVLVTRNSNDFGADRELAEDLVDDLCELDWRRIA